MAEFAGDQCPERAAGLTHTADDPPNHQRCESCGQPITFEKTYMPPAPEVRKVEDGTTREGPLARRKRMRWARPIADHETVVTREMREDRLFRELGPRGRRRLEFLRQLHEADPSRFR